MLKIYSGFSITTEKNSKTHKAGIQGQQAQTLPSFWLKSHELLAILFFFCDCDIKSFHSSQSGSLYKMV